MRGPREQALSNLWIQSQGTDWADLAGGEALRLFTKGEGCRLTDIEGRQFLDGLSGLFVVAVGHGRAEIAEAMAAQARELAYVAASRFSVPSTTQLAETLADLTPGDLSRTHFCSGGSEANETALKIAKQVQALRGFTKRYKVIARRGSYHGATYGAMSLTSVANEKFFGPFVPGTSFVPSPNRYRNDFELEGEAGDIMCAQAVEQEILTQGPDTVAAFVGEPISAANGVHVPSPIYWQMIREICDRYGVLLIMDEVVTGFGRTGKLFGAEHFGVVPDITTIAKGLSSGYAPIGGVVVREEVFEDFKQPGSSLSHLITYGGNPVSAAAANKNLEILLGENLTAQAATGGEHLLELLRKLLAHPTVGDVRGRGLLTGIELVKSQQSKENWGLGSDYLKFIQVGIERRGLLTRVFDTMFVAPPLVATHEDLAEMVDIIDDTLTDAETTFAREIEESAESVGSTRG